MQGAKAMFQTFTLSVVFVLLTLLSACRAAAPGGQSDNGTAGSNAAPTAPRGSNCQVPSAKATDREAQARVGAAYRACFDRTHNSEDARLATDAYIRAAKLSRDQENRLLYTSEISELLVQQGDRKRLSQVFDDLLGVNVARDPDGHYLALTDYASALAKLHDESAWKYFESAIDLHPQNNIEAINRYAQALIDAGHPKEAAEMLDRRLTKDQRIRFVRPAYLRQEALRRAGLDTASADKEVAAIESRRRGRTGT